MTARCAEFIRERDRMLAREIDRLCHDRAMTAMTGHGNQAEELAMTKPFTYKYDIRTSTWIIYLYGREIDSRLTEEEAAAYCENENRNMKSQTIGGDSQ